MTHPGQALLSGAICAQDAELEGQPVYLRFTLPILYPQEAPNLQVHLIVRLSLPSHCSYLHAGPACADI